MTTGLSGLGEIQVNSPAASGDGLTGTQADPVVTALSNGNFVVVYENPQAGGSNINLLAHFFDANGNPINPPVSSGLPNNVVGIDQTTNVTIHPAIAATANGGFVVAYTDVTHNTIDVRRYDPTTGVSAQFAVDGGSALDHQPNVGPVDNAAIATFADGTIVVAWEFDFASSATNHDVYFAYLNSTASGFVQGVASLDVHNAFEGEARVATSGNTAAIVYAADPGTINGGQDIILTLFNSSGTELATPATIFGTSSSEVFSHPDVAALSDGRFVIAAHDDTPGTVQVALYNPVTHAVTSLSGLTGAGASPHVAGLPDGGFILSLDTAAGEISELRTGPGGSILFDPGLVNSFTTGIQSQNAIAANANGSAFFAWQDAGSANPHSTDADTRIEGSAFSVQQLQPVQPVQPSQLVGTSADDFFVASGNQSIDGLGGNDTIIFNFKLTDATISFAGNQVIVGGPSGSHTVLTSFEIYRFTDGTVNENDGNPLVDDLYYYSHNHDVWNAHADADAHFATSGWHEGRDPNPFFSIGAYLNANPDVKAAGVNPLNEYDQNGWKEGRDPGPNFDTTLYLVRNPDVAAAGVDPLAHYLQSGEAEGRQAFQAIGQDVNGFDAEYYLMHNPDVAAAGVDPLQHYLQFGWTEGRNPNADFDDAGYLAHYADVKNAGVNPLLHYEQSGWHEGRDPSAQFDTLGYLAANPDVAAAHVNPLDHYLQSGIYEGRAAINDGVFH